MGPPLTLSESEESELGSLARSRTLPHSLVLRAQIVLACAEGATLRRLYQQTA